MSLDRLFEEIMAELEINEDAMNRELIRQPSKFAYWGALCARASKKLAKQKLELAELKARLGRDYRLMMKEKEPNTRVTESMVDTFVITTEDFQKQANTVIYAQHEDDILTIAKESFRQRANMILQLARMRAEEMYETDMTIFKKEAKGRYEDKIGTQEAVHKFKGLLGGKSNERTRETKGRARRSDGEAGRERGNADDA